MELKNQVLVIIQARYNSTRFPGKVVKKINNKTILEILIKRLNKSKYVSKIIVACSKNQKDKAIINVCKKTGINYFSGSENDVLDRYYQAAKKYKALNVVRITADCPLIDPKIVDQVIINFFLKKVDYASNVNPPTFPDGMDIEIFKFSALKEAYTKAKLVSEREHVTPFIINNKKFKKFNLQNFEDNSSLRLTLDEKEDFILIQKIIKSFKNNIHFNLKNILDLYKKNKDFFSINSHIKRNEGYDLNLGQKMWKRAKNIIPGGTMLFSKNPDLFLPKFWPAYFEKTKGCNIWDLQGKKYLDLSMMGVGTNILGYSRKEVDNAVRNIIDRGNMSTLNSKEEVLLAEKLVEMHPWSSMVRFTRTGGEALAVAIRIARAASGKNNVAICGYHGWHDWYLSANLSDSNNLNSHLMRNLPIKGVNQKLKNSAFAFEYNKLDQLKDIIKKNNIGAVIMEVSRNEKPESNFLEKIRSLTKKKNIILIFDECTSGFRETYGGLHLKYKISPDIAMFGKALGNGYAVNAVLGSYEVMKYAESTFISSTFWTERIGSAAALATLELMKKIKSWEIISTIGLNIKKNWQKIANSHKLKIKIEGLDALPKFNFDSKFNLIYKTFISQEFLKKNFLASNAIYACTEHNPKIINRYFEILDDIFCKIAKTNPANEDFKLNLEGPCCIGSLRDKIYDKK
jgi:glutamate-1-semialdehyde aminotransferase/spore coat polysaccharide biosynthesis protein SpsF (cytidylyltransferase family)